MNFGFFDPESKVDFSRRKLPHWEQRDAYYFLTWRTADSIPQSVLQQWLTERETWLQAHGINPVLKDWQREVEKLPEDDHKTFYREFTLRWLQMLDDCHGECLLRNPSLSEIVAENLHHQNGDKYELEAWVIMPNHVHVLVGVPGRNAMKQLCRNWKNYTAKRINESLNRQGQLWQWESFDHLVRSPASLEKFRQYILKNPTKAQLKNDEYRVWAKAP